MTIFSSFSCFRKERIPTIIIQPLLKSPPVIWRAFYFLNVSQGLDNYTAIRVWAEKWLKTHYPVFDDTTTLDDLQHDDTLYSELKSQFFSHFPQTATA